MGKNFFVIRRERNHEVPLAVSRLTLQVLCIFPSFSSIFPIVSMPKAYDKPWINQVNDFLARTAFDIDYRLSYPSTSLASAVHSFSPTTLSRDLRT